MTTNERQPLIQVQHLGKAFGDLNVLKDINVDIYKGDVVCVIGPSGSGKSTLLRCCTFLETLSSGEIAYMGETAVSAEDGKKPVYAPTASFKKIQHYFGLVFQNFNLFPHYSVLRNITEAPRLILKKNKTEAETNAMRLLQKVGLADKAKAYPCELSGGQQQRVAIGRALITKPKLILADEPTGNLDSKNSQDVIALLTQASRRYQQTILMITHNKDLTASVDRVFRVSDGVLTDLGGKTNEALS